MNGRMDGWMEKIKYWKTCSKKKVYIYCLFMHLPEGNCCLSQLVNPPLSNMPCVSLILIFLQFSWTYCNWCRKLQNVRKALLYNEKMFSLKTASFSPLPFHSFVSVRCIFVPLLPGVKMTWICKLCSCGFYKSLTLCKRFLAVLAYQRGQKTGFLLL